MSLERKHHHCTISRPGTSLVLAVLATTTSWSLANAQLFFDPQKVIYQNAVHQPETVLAVDIDGDLDNDLVALGGASLDARIVWFENTDGMGAFGPAQEISGPVDSTSVIVAVDIDGDTDLDIAAGSGGSDNKVFWFENTDGLGDFDPRNVITPASNVSDLVAANIDGDADMDLIYTSTSSGTVRWLENTDGLGSFAAPQTIASLGFVCYVAAGNLDGDTDVDVVFANSIPGGQISWVENTDGMGNFGTPQSIASIDSVEDIHLEDFGADGDLDVVYGSDEGGLGALGVFPNNGSGSFGTEVSINTGMFPVDKVVTADIDGDTDPDIVYLSRDFFDVAWAEQTGVGSGAFGTPQTITGLTEFPAALAAADVNGDTDVDVMVGWTPAELAWHENTTGTGTFGAGQPVATGFGQFDHLLVTDLEDDDTPDVLVSNSEQGLVHRFQNNGAGAFAAPQSLITGVPDASFLTLGDVNGDSDPDLVVSRTDGGVLNFYPATAGPTFGSQVTLDNTHFGPYGTVIADVDGANGPDIVTAFNGEAAVATFANNGSGSFGSYNALPGTISGFPQSVATGDVDGDTDLDIITGGPVGGRLYLYTNTGGGAFSSAVEIDDLTEGLDWLYLVDLDGDTDLDILGRLNVSIFWKENTGGTFGAAQTIATTSQADMIQPVDFDLDLDMDVVSVDTASHEVAWHENDGTGSFTEHIVATTLQQPYWVGAADMDDDADLDIVVASLAQVNVVWFEQVPEPPAPPGPLELWAQTFGLTGDDLLPTSDKDGDGVNLVGEFAQNLNPTVADGIEVPETAGVSGTARVFYDEGGIGIFKFKRINCVYIRRKNPASLGLSYLVQGSEGMVTWSPYTQSLLPTSIDADFERIHVRQNIFPSNPDAYFGRLHIEYTPPPTP